MSLEGVASIWICSFTHKINRLVRRFCGYNALVDSELIGLWFMKRQIGRVNECFIFRCLQCILKTNNTFLEAVRLLK